MDENVILLVWIWGSIAGLGFVGGLLYSVYESIQLIRKQYKDYIADPKGQQAPYFAVNGSDIANGMGLLLLLCVFWPPALVLVTIYYSVLSVNKASVYCMRSVYNRVVRKVVLEHGVECLTHPNNDIRKLAENIKKS